MTQYRLGKQYDVVNKDGKKVKISDFRERNKYQDDYIYTEQVGQHNYTRPDIIAIQNYGRFDRVGALIDVNEKDIFDFDIGDNIYLVVSEVVIG